MNEQPIIFSGPMVRAILEGRKTQTRRVVKPQPMDVGFGRNCEVHPYCTGTKWPLAYYERRGGCWNSSDKLRCPYGQSADLLWVKEAIGLTTSGTDEHPAVVYRASNPEFVLKWKRSTIMPRWASRLTLELTGVRVERLQEISEADAEAEGAQTIYKFAMADAEAEGAQPIYKFAMAGHRRDHRAGFRDIWDSLNATKHPWASNPWVWVLEFRRLA